MSSSVGGGPDLAKVADGGAAVGHAVRNSRAVEGLARAGLVTRGVVYLVVALLTVQVAVGKPAKTDNQNGAIQEIASRPFGRVMLIALAFGFGSYALWRFSVAAVGPAGDRPQRGGRPPVHTTRGCSPRSAHDAGVPFPERIGRRSRIRLRSFAQRG